MTGDGPRLVLLSVSAGAPSVPSDIVLCSSCGVPCWRSRRARQLVAVPVCLDCAIRAGMIADGFVPAPYVAADLVDVALGHVGDLD